MLEHACDPEMAFFGSNFDHVSKSRVGLFIVAPEMAQNSNHFWLEFYFSSNFEPSQDFRAKISFDFLSHFMRL